jgi:threonine dehydrogenase-like Zn-dependent dehydrogenase
MSLRREPCDDFAVGKEAVMNVARKQNISERPLIMETRLVKWNQRELDSSVAPGMVRIATETTLISPGTELRLYRGDAMPQQVWDSFAVLDKSTRGREAGGQPEVTMADADRRRYPVGLGYNNVGRVVACGAGVQERNVGERVFTIARHESVFDVEEWEAIPLPGSVASEDAVFLYVATLGLHALRRGGWQPGEWVGVIGLGVIGLATALTAYGFGGSVVLFDVARSRRELAGRLLPGVAIIDPSALSGLREVVDVRHQRVSLVIDAAGGVPALRLAMRVVDSGGRIVLLSLHAEEVGAVFGGLFYEKELSILGTGNDPYYLPAEARGPSIPRNIATILELLVAGRISYAGMATDHYKAADAAKALHDLDVQLDGAMVGVLLDW